MQLVNEKQFLRFGSFFDFALRFRSLNSPIRRSLGPLFPIKKQYGLGIRLIPWYLIYKAL